jgi:molecular chaperone Hsp33
MQDTLLAGVLGDGGVAAYAATTTQLVREIQRRHDLWPTATAAVGRLATGAALLGAGLEARERISLQIAGDGPLGSLSAEAWRLDGDAIGVRGYARNPHVDLPVDARGKFDVGGAVGNGSLQVTKSYDAGPPYVGIVPLHSGEIAEDLATYLARSEQIPSIVALGVLANPSGVVAAGGLLVQALPGAQERVLAELEARALEMPAITTMIAGGAQAKDLLRALVGESTLRSRTACDVLFACRCTHEKVSAMLRSLGPGELREMAAARQQTEAVCEFCKRPYVFTDRQLAALADGVGSEDA